MFNKDVEVDADIWGTLISMSAGYDPYAAAGTLAKLSMATGASGLVELPATGAWPVIIRR